MSNIKIIVCCHKEAPLISKKDDIYLPVQVGRAINNDKLDMAGDDTGDNISAKNKTYCELTGLYWAWKNLKNLDYAGLCHYRRHFDIENISLEKTFKKYDVILVKPVVLPFNNLSNIAGSTTQEDTYILINIIYTHFPKYKKAILDYLYNSNKWVPYNMFITSSYHFGNYSKWLFDVLSIFETQIKISEYTRLKRIFGYMGEILLPVYCIANNLKIDYIDLAEHRRKNIKRKAIHFIRHSILVLRNNIYFKLLYPFKIKQIEISAATFSGLTNDNIALSSEFKKL